MRAKGEGSVYQLPNGKWQTQVYTGNVYPDGRPKPIRRNADTQREALAIRDRLLRQGPTPDPDRQTLAQYCDDYLAGIAPTKAPKTVAAYRCDLAHVTRHYGHLPLGKFRAQHVRALHATLLAEGLAPKTVLNVHATLSRALKVAVQDDLIDKNPADKVSRPRVERTEQTPLTVDEARTLLAALDGDRFGPMWTLKVALGLRLGEVLGLTWDRVDFDERRVRVRKQLRRVDGHYRLADLKVAKQIADLPLPGFVGEALREHRKRQLQEQMKAERWLDGCCRLCKGGTGWGLVFTTQATDTLGRPARGEPGRALTDTVPRNALYKVSEEVLGRRVKPHDFRHTTATLLMAEGVPLAFVQEILRHSSITTTKDMYGHLTSEHLSPAADAMDGLFG